MQTRQWVKQNGQQRGMSLIGMLLVMVMIGLVAVVAMQVIPMYTQYLSIKSTIETVSYTHLDVYKRQCLNRSPNRCRPGTSR